MGIRQAGLARGPNTPSSPVFLYSQMSGYNWTWPQIPSLTAMKYQRHGYVEVRPFELGERMCGRRGLERFVKGYRQIRSDLDKKREELDSQTPPGNNSIRDNFIKVEFYKPVVASRTRKLGGLYRSNTVGRMGFFMHH